MLDSESITAELFVHSFLFEIVKINLRNSGIIFFFAICSRGTAWIIHSHESMKRFFSRGDACRDY